MLEPAISLLGRAGLVAALVLAGCGTSDRATTIDAPGGADAATTDGPSGPPVELDGFTATAADAVCAALFRCCDDDLVTYFAPFRADERLAAFADRLPPAAALDEAGCRAVLREIYDVTPFGDWVAAARRGDVAYLPAAAGACAAELGAAACGAPARAALYDSTCFAYAAPGGGAEQRRMFARTRTAGATCAPIRDGLGGVFYGSCDPTQAFCCYAAAGSSGCQFPFAADGTTRPGTCQPVAAAGQACSTSLPLQLCATGADCDSATDQCRAGVDAPLAIGATCVDASFNLLGVCQASWCDVLGTKRCEALRADGATCGGGDECASGLCQGTCRPNDVCTGAAAPTDAGVPDAPLAVDAGAADAPPPTDAPPPIDAGTPDAPPAGDGERCATALDLLAASTGTPSATYTHRVSASFGASNDYNPLNSSGLPPACSVVYDARGKERVFAITLAPGDRLRLRAELTDGRQAGIYLLDTCPGGSWPDFDNSTACGSNEYNVGFCGITGCDPAVLNILYPTSLGGAPTQPATFWVVVDQVGGDTSPGFNLDWQRIAP